MKYPIVFLLLTLIILLGQWGQQVSAETAEVGVEGEVKEKAEKNAEKTAEKAAKKAAKKSHKKKSQKDWARTDFNALDKEWEGGDDEEELEQEYELSRKAREKTLKQKNEGLTEMLKKDPLALNMGTGGSMMFAKLHKSANLTTKEINKLAAKWTTMLRSSGVNAQIVNVGGDEEQGTLLLSVDKVWYTSDIVTFVLRQKECEKITINNRDLTIKDLPAEEDD
jgi:Chaperone for wingless signalling and trafficking of LDL receptor